MAPLYDFLRVSTVTLKFHRVGSHEWAGNSQVKRCDFQLAK